MTDRDLDLDSLFAEAAAVVAEPSAGLTARILADAEREQPKPQPLARPVKPGRSRGGAFGWALAFADVLGGGRALAGLSFAGMAGLYLGVAQPAVVQGVTALLAGQTVVEQMDLLPASGTLWTEN